MFKLSQFLRVRFENFLTHFPTHNPVSVRRICGLSGDKIWEIFYEMDKNAIIRMIWALSEIFSPLFCVQNVFQGVVEKVEGEYQQKKCSRSCRELPPHSAAH